MAQGKEWTVEEKERIIQSLQPYLEMGYSRNKSCDFIGLAPSTLSNWVSEDDSLGMKLTSWENMVNTIAVQNIIDGIKKETKSKDSRRDNSWKWAERKIKELSPKSETDITSKGESIQPVLVKFIDAENNRDTD